MQKILVEKIQDQKRKDYKEKAKAKGRIAAQKEMNESTPKVNLTDCTLPARKVRIHIPLTSKHSDRDQLFNPNKDFASLI